MKIIVRAKPKAKEERVERVSQPTLGFRLKPLVSGSPDHFVEQNDLGKMVEYKVSVKEAPVGGKANEAICKALAKYFDVAPSLVRLVSGGRAKKKVFEVFN